MAGAVSGTSAALGPSDLASAVCLAATSPMHSARATTAVGTPEHRSPAPAAAAPLRAGERKARWSPAYASASPRSPPVAAGVMEREEDESTMAGLLSTLSRNAQLSDTMAELARAEPPPQGVLGSPQLAAALAASLPPAVDFCPPGLASPRMHASPGASHDEACGAPAAGSLACSPALGAALASSARPRLSSDGSGYRMPAAGHWFLHGCSRALLVSVLKNGQRVDKGFKQQWDTWCDKQALGVRNPTKVPFEVLEGFLRTRQRVILEHSDWIPICQYYLKEGACRRGHDCSRAHVQLPRSRAGSSHGEASHAGSPAFPPHASPALSFAPSPALSTASPAAPHAGAEGASPAGGPRRESLRLPERPGQPARDAAPLKLPPRTPPVEGALARASPLLAPARRRLDAALPSG